MNEDIWKDWFFNLEEARATAQQQRKPILLQFHRDRCSGCKKMYAVTYPNPDVYRELREWFVPLRLDILKDRRERVLLSAVWTPSFYVLDYKSKLYFSVPGYLDVEDFRLILRLGLAEYLIPKGKYEEAKSILNEGLQLFPNNPRAATLFFRIAMIEYLQTWDNKRFRARMTELRELYPGSAEARQWPWMD